MPQFKALWRASGEGVSTGIFPIKSIFERIFLPYKKNGFAVIYLAGI